jgi:hypothetical protein
MPEVVDANEEQFGLERIGEIVARNADGPLADVRRGYSLLSGSMDRGPTTRR